MTRSCARTRSIVNDDGLNAWVGFAHCWVSGRCFDGAGDGEADGEGDGDGDGDGDTELADGEGDGVGDFETGTLGAGLSVGSAVCEPRGHQMMAPTKSSSARTMAAATTIRFLVICTNAA